MTKIPVASFDGPKTGSLTSDQRRWLAEKYPTISSEAALVAVEHVLNEFFVDIERYGMMPSYADTQRDILELRKTLAKSTKQLRALTSSGADNTREFLAVELEKSLATFKAGRHLSLEFIDDALGTVDIVLEEVMARLTARHGGKKGKPPEVAVDMWIERMICLWEALGGDISRTWVDNSITDEGVAISPSGRRSDVFFDLLVDLVAVANSGFMPGGENTTAVAADLSIGALGQRTYRVLTAWAAAHAFRRQRRKDEIKKFCTSVLRPSPPESGNVPSREKEAREDGDANKPRSVRRSTRSTGSTRGKPARRRQGFGQDGNA